MSILTHFLGMATYSTSQGNLLAIYPLLPEFVRWLWARGLARKRINLEFRVKKQMNKLISMTMKTRNTMARLICTLVATAAVTAFWNEALACHNKPIIKIK